MTMDKPLIMEYLKTADIRLLPVMCAAGVVLLAIIGLAGYLPWMGTLPRIRPDYIPMAPATAFSFMLLGGAMLVLNTRHVLPRQTFVLLFIALTVSLYGLLVFTENLVDRDLNLERFIFPDMGELDGVPIGKMSGATGLLFCLTGFSIALYLLGDFQQKRRKLVDYSAAYAGVASLIISFIFCLAYIHGSPLLYGQAPIIPMALTTACGFMLLSISILSFRPESFPVSYLTGSSTRSYLLRFILPLTVLSVVFGGIAANSRIQMFDVNPAIVTGFLTIVMICFGLFFATMIARHLGHGIDRHNEAIKESGLALRESEAKYRTLFETMEQGVVFQDTDGVIITANPASERILGRDLNQMMGKTSGDPGWKAVDKDRKELAEDEHPAMMALHSGMPVKDYIQGIFNPITNDYVWIIVNSIPQFRKGEHKPYQVFSTFLDITKRMHAENEILRLKSGLETLVEQRTIELKDKIEKLNKSQQAMLYMVEDLNRITAELTEKRKNLELSNAELEAFSYSVSHDLRAPLRAIDGFTKILMEDHAGKLDDDGKRVCDVISSNTVKMGKLIDDLLAFSRLGRLEMKNTEIDMNSLVTTIFSELATSEKRKQIDFDAGDLQPAVGDPTMIRQVWVNLISNAIKFTASTEKPMIRVRSRREDRFVVYEIQDNGVGFDMQYIDKVFGVFQRLHSSRDFEGTGVGLAIVHRIVQRHDGQVKAKGSPGNGACFTFNLPL